MCMQRDPKTRFLMAGANLALVVGLLLWTFARPVSTHRELLDGLCGLLMGLSIGLNFYMLRRGRRCGVVGREQR